MYVCETNGRTYRYGGDGGVRWHRQHGTPACGPCRGSNREKFRRWREANADRARENWRSWRKANRDRVRENDRRWREANADKVREYSRRYYEANPDKMREYSRRWREANPDWAREVGRRRERKRRELKRRAHIEWVDEAEILAKTEGRCWLCGIVLDLVNRNADNGFHVDHIWPLNAGGLGWEPNLAAACGSCNQSKGDRILDFRFAFVGLIPPPHLWLEDREWPDVPPRSEWKLDGRAAEVDQMMQRIGARERFTPPPAPAKWKAFRQDGIRPTGKMKRRFKAAITVKENNDPAS